MAKVIAAWQAKFAEQFRHRVGRLHDINQPRLLPIHQVLLIDAPFLFYEFVRLSQQVLPELQLPDVLLQRF